MSNITSMCANGFLNCNETIGKLIISSSENITGSDYLTFFLVFLFLIAIGFLYMIKLEYIMILLFPLMIGFMAYYSKFMAIIIVTIIYLSIIITKTFIIK